MNPQPFVVEQYSSAEAFLADAGAWLEQNEPRNNVVLGVAHLLASGTHPFQSPIYLAAVKESGRVVGCAVRPPPDHLDLTDMPAGAAAALGAVAADFCPGLSRIGGPPAAAEAFARAWDGVSCGASRITHRWSWLTLRAVTAPAPVPGRVRVADDRDRELIEAWAPELTRDTGDAAGGDALPFLLRRLRTRSLYFWDDDGPKCTASISGHTPRGLRVSAVYTPAAFRRRGYASNLVAAISQRVLTEGRTHCVLFGETARPDTLRIYQRVGYAPSHDTVIVELGGLR